MKNFLTAVILGSLAAVSIFGFFAMGHAADHGNCIAATLQGRVCTSTDVFGVAAYHLSAFEKAARATLANSLTTFLALMLLAAAFFALATGLPPGKLIPIFSSRLDHFSSPQKISLWRWLSFHENSPNLF